MSEHTKGRLTVKECSDGFELKDDSGNDILVGGNSGYDGAYVESEANARRLAACWNACEGLSQDHFDGDWTAKGLSKYAKSLEEKSAALEKELAAARALIQQQDALLGNKACATKECRELLAARELLREVLSHDEKVMRQRGLGLAQPEHLNRIRSYLDACDTLEGK